MALTISYLRFFKPEGLLAAAGWPRGRLDGFFSERFCLEVPEELVLVVHPFLTSLREKVGAGQTACAR